VGRALVRRRGFEPGSSSSVPRAFLLGDTAARYSLLIIIPPLLILQCDSLNHAAQYHITLAGNSVERCSHLAYSLTILFMHMTYFNIIHEYTNTIFKLRLTFIFPN
jgi:hypothetical protein